MLFVWVPLPSKPTALPPVPHSVANATSLPGRGESVQGDGFSSGGKLCGSAERRPLGGAGCERSEQTEGVLPTATEGVLLPQKQQENLYFDASTLIRLKSQKTAKFFENMC